MLLQVGGGVGSSSFCADVQMSMAQVGGGRYFWKCWEIAAAAAAAALTLLPLQNITSAAAAAAIGSRKLEANGRLVTCDLVVWWCCLNPLLVVVAVVVHT